MASPAEQITEYEGQLADVDSLLAASPDDPSLLSLKSDLVELIAITKQQTSNGVVATNDAAASNGGKALEKDANPSLSSNALDHALNAAVGTSVGREADDEKPSFADTVIDASNGAATMSQSAEGDVSATETTLTTKDLPKKKLKVKAEFEVPRHLIPLESDTAAERNKKRRALKTMKSKWRESKKEAESAKKQKSWQSFQKKKKLKTSSMFQTGDTAVGVVSAAGRHKTEFGERKRHNHL